MASYDASKAGVTQFTRTIALEHAGLGIRANVVTPGLMDTPTIVAPYSAIAGADAMEEVRRRRAEAVPMGRMGDGWDVAHAALFLAPDRPRMERRPAPEAVFHEIRFRIDDHLAADPVRPCDPPDQYHVVPRGSHFPIPNCQRPTTPDSQLPGTPKLAVGIGSGWQLEIGRWGMI